MPAPATDTPAAAEFLRLGSAAAGPRQVVLVPGEEVPLLTLGLPDGLRGQAREQVARRQLADRLGQAPGLRPCVLASAPGRKAAGAWTRVLAADPAWLESLRGLPGRAVLPDYLSLPAAEGIWTLGPGSDGAVMARLGPGDGFSAQPPLAAAMLKRALQDGPAPKALLLLEDALPAARALAETRDIPVLETPEAAEQLGLPRPVVLGHGELECDLRNNPMAARAQLARQVLPWRWPLLAAALAAALWAAAQMLAIQRLEAHSAQLAAATRALVQDQFTGGAPVLDIRLQVSRALAGLRAAAAGPGGGPGPLELAGRTADAVAATGSIPEMLSYRAGEGLTLVIRLPDFAAADRLAAALRAEGLAARLADSRTAGGGAGVRAEFAITAAEARP